MSEKAITEIVKELEDALAKSHSENATQVVVPRRALNRILTDWQSMRSAIYGRMEQSSKEGAK